MDTELADLKMDAVRVGDCFKSYTALCRAIGITPARGNSRPAQMKELRRYFDWKRGDGYALTITEVYPKPKPKTIRADDKYTEDVHICLRWAAQKSAHANGNRLFRGVWKQTYSFEHLLKVCGFVNERYRGTDPFASKQIIEFRQANPNSSLKQCKWCFAELDSHVRKYCRNVLDRCLNRLVSHGHIEDWNYDFWLKYDSGLERASPLEEARLKDIDGEIKRQLGITHLNYYNRSKYYRLFEKRAANEFDCDAVYRLREIAMDLGDTPVKNEEYQSARQRINTLSLERFGEYVASDIDKSKSRLWDETLASADAELLDVIELFEITPDDLYESNYPNAIETYWLKSNLVRWFIMLA